MNQLNSYKIQKITESQAPCSEIFSSAFQFNYESTATSSSPACFSKLSAKRNSKKESGAIFNVQKGCSSKKKKHILKFEQISILENYFHIDPEWKMSTVGKFTFSFLIKIPEIPSNCPSEISILIIFRTCCY